KGDDPIEPDILDALRDYSVLAGLAISIKELRDKLSQFYDHNRNLVLSGQHSAAIGHDIRSLNVGVGGFLTLALRALGNSPGPEGRPRVKELVAMARDNVGQIEALLGDFAQFNRPDIVLNRDTDLRDALEEKMESLKNRADFGRLVDFRLSLPEGKTGLLVDRDWFSTVVENLVKNSFEACGGPTQLHVSLRDDPDRIILNFEDDCGGIPAEMQRDIFTPFKTSKKKGQGLGLANAKKVIADHGGRIYVTSRQGHGAVFTIEFDRKASGGRKP
ncbi:MAG: HAMP domain-containing sensor histidine kinase, partial [Thermodesulfobacteriota bacterium]